MSRLTPVVDRAKRMLAGFTLGQKAIVVLAVLALVLGAVALGRWVSQPTWSPLFSDLSAADASAIVEELTTEGVQYKLASGGSTIMVPRAQVYDLRVALAGKGLTNSSETSSYSVLDNQGMTATDFQQNIAYQRALEGELNRTLGAVTGVKTAIVHLAIPEKDVFTTVEDRPTASVLLSLAPGTALGRAQIRSVMHLVAGSVPGLNASDVTVSDAAGNLLSVREDGEAGTAGSAGDAEEQTQAFEDAKGTALQTMLDKVLGKGRAVVRVNAELNFDTNHTTSKTFVSQTGLPPIAEATSSESYSGANNGVGGALGQTWPTLSAGAGGAGGGNYVKVERTVNNPVGEVVSETKAAPGSVKRLSVAVVLDSKAAAGANTSQIQQLVANAVGIDPARGDTVQVDRLEFDTEAAAAAAKELAQAQAAAKTAQYVDLGQKAGVGLLLVILAFVFLRRRKRDLPQVEAVARDLPPMIVTPPPTATPVILPSEEERLAIGAAALENRDIAPDALDPSLERELLRNEVSRFVEQQPDEIAAIVQGWLSQRKG
ncbi:MAG: flagellar M-ring protein FliF [Actinomycetota bacterium]|nr:flagellar M-ring protein FliF [Actinomycetota bacterium]